MDATLTIPVERAAGRPLAADVDIKLSARSGEPSGVTTDSDRACIRVQVASSWWQRARGLLASPPPAEGAGMLFPNTAAVHGFGMRHPLDLVFMDADARVLRCCRLPRWGVRSCQGASMVLELREHEAGRLGIVPGIQLVLVAASDIFSAPSHLNAGVLQGRSALPRRNAAPLHRRTVLPHKTDFSAWALILACGMLAVAAPETAAGQMALSRPLAAMPAADLSPVKLDELMLEAEQYYRQGRDDEALLLFSSLIELSEQHREQAWLRVGNIHQRHGATGAAVDAYRRLQGVAAVQEKAADAARKARRLKAMINLAAISIEQSRQSLQEIESLQQDEAVRLAAGLDRAAGQALMADFRAQVAQIRALMVALEAWDEAELRQLVAQQLNEQRRRQGLLLHRLGPAGGAARSGSPRLPAGLPGGIQDGRGAPAAAAWSAGQQGAGPEILVGGLQEMAADDVPAARHGARPATAAPAGQPGHTGETGHSGQAARADALSGVAAPRGGLGAL